MLESHVSAIAMHIVGDYVEPRAVAWLVRHGAMARLEGIHDISEMASQELRLAETFQNEYSRRT